MKRSVASRILGFDAIVEKLSNTSYHAHTTVEEGRSVSAVARNESDALKMLVEAAYQIRRGLAFKRDRYRCVNCGRLGSQGVGVEIDHIIPRARGGRLDMLSNLRSVCCGGF